MTAFYLKRPLRLRLAWRLEAIYLRWRIRCAEADRRGHEREWRNLKCDIDRMSRQIDIDEQFSRELVQRLGRVLAK